MQKQYPETTELKLLFKRRTVLRTVNASVLRSYRLLPSCPSGSVLTVCLVTVYLEIGVVMNIVIVMVVVVLILMLTVIVICMAIFIVMVMVMMIW